MPATEWAETSAAQDGLWYLNRLYHGSAQHHVHRVYRVTGPLDVGSLSAAWRTMAGRHGALRTTLVERAGRPTQRIAPEYRDDEPSFVDLTADRTTPERWCEQQIARPMRLATGPLARLRTARIGNDEYLVVLILHQAIIDEPSTSKLVSELSAHYAASVPPGGPPPVQFADYTRRRRNPEGRLLDWWTSALTPLPALAASLPLDRPHPANPSFAAGVVRFDWGDRVGRALARRCAAEQATPFEVLLAALQSLLFRYGGEERIAVGAPVTVRPRSGFHDAIGAFENLLVLCADFSGRPTFRDLLGRVARFTRHAVDRRELPFDRLVSALGPDRAPGRLPMCDVLFDYRAEPEAELDLPGVTVRREHVHGGHTRTDLTLRIDRAGPAVAGHLEYRRCLLDRASAHRIAGQLRVLLTAALREPGTPVDELPLEDPDRIGAAVRAADRTAAAPHAERPVHELVHARAARHPARHAVDRLTYAQLEKHAAAVGDALRELGGVHGSAVAVRMSPGARQVSALLGVLDAGGYVVCLGAGDAGERGKAVLSDVRPQCLVVGGERSGDPLCAWFRERLGGTVLDVDDLAARSRPPPAPGRLRDRAYVAYTSGSTGRPKGIAQSHGSFAQFVTWWAGEFGVGPGSRVAQWAAPGYDASLVEIFATLAAGGTVCPVPERIRAHPEKLVRWLAAERITLFQSVPSFARELLEVINSQGAPPALDHLLLAGEALPGELANRLRAALPAVRLVNLYGPTESILATWHEVAGPVHGMTPVGRSIPGRQVLVLDDSDRPCAAGVTGNIVIRSPYLTPRYFGAAAADEAPFAPLHGPAEYGLDRGACYRTGDLGRLRWDGPLEFRGRRDFQVKFHGTRVELTEIETALAAHPPVAECAVLPVTGEDGLVTRLVAYVVPRRGTASGPADWREVLRRRFGELLLPVSFKRVAAMPRNIGGKVDRGRLPAPDPSGARTAREPASPAEKAMAAIWSELLGHEQGSTDHTFFAAGGHSLLVLRLLDRVTEQFHVDVSLEEYFENPTLAALAALVEAKVTAKPRP